MSKPVFGLLLGRVFWGSSTGECLVLSRGPAADYGNRHRFNLKGLITGVCIAILQGR